MFNTYLQEMLTGDPILDGYLKQIDKKLWGIPKHRALILIEIKDHLEQKKQKYMDQGLSQDSSSTKAVDEMGPINVITLHQRKELIKNLVTISFTTGISFTILMYIACELMISYSGLPKFSLSFFEFLKYGMYAGILMGIFFESIDSKKND